MSDDEFKTNKQQVVAMGILLDFARTCFDYVAWLYRSDVAIDVRH